MTSHQVTIVRLAFRSSTYLIQRRWWYKFFDQCFISHLKDHLRWPLSKPKHRPSHSHSTSSDIHVESTTTLTLTDSRAPEVYFAHLMARPSLVSNPNMLGWFTALLQPQFQKPPHTLSKIGHSCKKAQTYENWWRSKTLDQETLSLYLSIYEPWPFQDRTSGLVSYLFLHSSRSPKSHDIKSCQF